MRAEKYTFLLPQRIALVVLLNPEWMVELFVIPVLWKYCRNAVFSPRRLFEIEDPANIHQFRLIPGSIGIREINSCTFAVISLIFLYK